MKRFLAIGRKPVEPVAPPQPAKDFERGNLVRHVKTGVAYRILSVWPSLSVVHARRIILADDFETSPNGNWRFAPQRKTVRLAQANIALIP